MRFVQLIGPNGAFYVDPERVDAIGHARPEARTGEQDVRDIVVNGQWLVMFDDSKNMQSVLK